MQARAGAGAIRLRPRPARAGTGGQPESEAQAAQQVLGLGQAATLGGIGTCSTTVRVAAAPSAAR